MADLTGSTFSKDPLCPDTLIFSRSLCKPLQSSALTTTHVLNIQVEMSAPLNMLKLLLISAAQGSCKH